MAKRITVPLPKNLLDSARQKAKAEGRTLNSLIEEGLRVVVDGQSHGCPGRRVELPVSTATGGLRPGFDLKHYQAMEDEEYINRLHRPK